MASTKLDPRYEEAKRLFQQREYTDALALLDTLGPEGDANILFARARCLAKLGRKQEALRCCERLRTECNDPRWKKLAEKLGADPGGSPPPQEERLVPSVTAPKSRASRRVLAAVLVLGVAAGAVGVAALIRITWSDTAPVITGAPPAADEAAQPGPSSPSVAAQTTAPTGASPPPFRPDLTLKPRDAVGKLRIRGTGGFELDHADPYDVRMDNGFLSDEPSDLPGPTNPGRLRLRPSPFDTEDPGGSSEADPKVAQANLLPWLPASNPAKAAALLPRITHARQNCVAIIDGRDSNGFSIPGALVNDWGAGGWSANQDGDFVTLRAGVALQDFNGYRFLLFAYFTGATPNAMARVFQAYCCRYAMLLDMNTPNFCYATLYRRDAEGQIVGAEYLHKDMASGHGGSLKFLQTNDTRDFFYVYRKLQ